jgi:hypothetical protein
MLSASEFVAGLIWQHAWKGGGKYYHEIRNYRCRGSTRDRSSWIGRLRQQAETGTCSEQNRNVQITTIIKAGWNAVPPGLLLFDSQTGPCRIAKSKNSTQALRVE